MATRRTGRLLVEFTLSSPARVRLIYAGGRGGVYEVYEWDYSTTAG